MNIPAITPRHLFMLVACLASSIMLVYCGTPVGDEILPTTTSTPVEGTPAPATATDSLSNAFPGSLALSVFPRSTASALTASEFDPNAQALSDKIAEQEDIAAGVAVSCLPPALSQTIASPTAATCYEFDQDMIYGTNDTNTSSPNWLGTTNGKDAKGEACLVSFTRTQVSQVVAMVDQTLGFGMAALCQFKKDNPAAAKLPAIGTTIDLSIALAGLFAAKMTVTSATLERLEDSDGYPVYRIVIKAALVSEKITRTIGIIHSPYNDTNTEYSGTMYTIMEGVPKFGGGLGAPPPSQSEKYQLMSITYERTIGDTATTLNAELRSAQVAKALVASAISSSGVLDLNVGTNVTTAAVGSNNYGTYTGYSMPNDAVDGITFVAFSLDPDTNQGTLAYWKNPGGNYYENARGFNISIGKNATTANLEGCATSGSASINFSQGISVRRYLNPAESANNLTLTPKGFWHPFMNTPTSEGTDDTGYYQSRVQNSGQATKWYYPEIGNEALAHTFVSSPDGSLITRQCFAYDSAAAMYLIDTVQTTTLAGFDLLDTGNASNSAKFIALPPPVAPPADNVFKK